MIWDSHTLKPCIVLGIITMIKFSFAPMPMNSLRLNQSPALSSTCYTTSWSPIIVVLIIMDSIIAATAVVSGLPPTNIHHHCHFFHRICSMSIMNKKNYFPWPKGILFTPFLWIWHSMWSICFMLKKKSFVLGPCLELRYK